MMPNESMLPIKVVFPSSDDFSAPRTRWAEPRLFVEVTPELRSQLVAQVAEVRNHFEPSFERYPDVPAVAHLNLRSEASAKSYRPNAIFNEHTCPIIGVDDLGQLLVSVTRGGLDRVAEQIGTGASRQAEANISTLERIEPWTERDALRGEPPEDVVGRAAQQKRRALRCRLFRHRTEPANQALRRAFLGIVAELGVDGVEEVRYHDDVTVFALPDLSPDVLNTVARFAGAQSVSPFPDYRVVRTTAHVLGTIRADDLPPPVANTSYPLVGIIDSGTDPNNPILQAWIHARYDRVPRNRQSNDHGSFVAGLIAGGRTLNNGSERFPSSSARVVDVVALDQDGRIDEYDLITVIDEAIQRFPEVNVWNLSLELIGPCCDERQFSQLATALDQRARDHGVLFVIAAGNYRQTPLRGWPPADLADDRICPPADAVRGITVGSIAHLDSPSTCVRADEPSPFSRRGPGPAYLLAPDLAHYGGNCDANGRYLQTGVVSVDEAGNLAENIGTSFSAPLVATVVAEVWQELDVAAGLVGPLLAKALVLHSAFLRRVPTDINDTHYYGLGVPAEASEVIACTQSAATLILQIPVARGPVFEKRPFPMPTCLETESGLRAEVFMTLLHDTPLDPTFGIEYCRSNIRASLGTMRVDEETGEELYHREVDPVPKTATAGFEQDVLQYGYKWSPLKLYYRRFRRGPAGREWRLTLSRLDRAEYMDAAEQDVFLVVTVRDPAGVAYVYDEMVQAMHGLGWVTEDLQVRSRARLRG